MSYNSPGIYFEETSTIGGPVLRAPENVYMFGTAGTGSTALANTLTEVRSITEFTSKFGADSPSVPYVNAFFSQLLTGVMHFCAVTKAGTDPVAAELTTAINAVFGENTALGVLLAPEFFDKYPTIAVEVANVLGTAAQSFSLVAIIDPPSTAKASVGTPTTVGSVRKFAADITARSHSALYFPYLFSNGVSLPPSPFVAAVYVRAARQEGVAQPPAGQKFPLYGVTGASFTCDLATRNGLNPESINAICLLGNWVVYGGRVLGTTPAFVNSRVILNVEKFMLTQALENLLFIPFDSKGVAFTQLRWPPKGLCLSCGLPMPCQVPVPNRHTW